MPFKDGLKLMEAAKKTPVVDGSGLKNTLERQTVYYLRDNTSLLPEGCKVLMVSAVDRFGMAEALTEIGCDVSLRGPYFFGWNSLPHPVA